MSRTRIALLSLLGVALVGAGVAWWLHTYERVEESIDLPRTREAVTNPLFGLRVALEKDGRRVRAWRRLDPAAMHLQPGDVVVYDGDLRSLPARAHGPLLDWVHRGGHLVVSVPPADAAFDALQRRRSGDGVHLRVELLDDLGVRVRRGSGDCLEAADALPSFCGERRFDAPAASRVRLRDSEGDVFARVPAGAGVVDVVSSLEFLDTDHLERTSNATLAHQLLAGDARTTAHLVHVTDVPSLWLTLIRRGWPVWAPLLLLLLGWLWARARRFGPLLPSPALERRSLLEHVAASGEHQWRYGRGDALYTAMREAFLARLRRRDPEAALLEGEAQVQRLVERMRLPASQVRDALRRPDPRDAKALVARIAFLVRMRNRL